MKHTKTMLLPVLVLATGAASAAPSTTTLSVSNSSPAYSDLVTLTSTTQDPAGVAAATGTVGFYEDSGILLQTVNVTSGTAQWKQNFLAGQHSVYAVFSGNSPLATATSATVALNISSALAVPASGAYLGLRANPALGSTQEAAMEAREGPAPKGIGRPFALHLVFFRWQALAHLLDANGVFQPGADLQADIKHGRVPVIAWSCDGSVPNSDSAIARGDAKEDANITATARALAQYPGPVVLRWFWEFNALGHNESCRGNNGSPTQQTYSDYIAAWQRIWRLFQSSGATNVVFLWNPGSYKPSGLLADPHPFYPGNTYVDWIGIDFYQRSAAATFGDNMQLFYKDFSQAQYANKPLMVAENGAANWGRSEHELQWTYLQGALSAFEKNLFPRIKAYVYYDALGPAGSWCLDDNNGQGDGGLSAFSALGASSFFSSMPKHLEVR